MGEKDRTHHRKGRFTGLYKMPEPTKHVKSMELMKTVISRDLGGHANIRDNMVKRYDEKSIDGGGCSQSQTYARRS